MIAPSSRQLAVAELVFNLLIALFAALRTLPQPRHVPSIPGWEWLAMLVFSLPPPDLVNHPTQSAAVTGCTIFVALTTAQIVRTRVQASVQKRS
jgi:hypothetical protein